jgi:tetratricopeptide (TPR) repeat protein
LVAFGEPDAAGEYFGKALALSPRKAEFLYALALALDKQGNTEEAIRQLKRAVHLQPGLAQARERLDELLRRPGGE